MSAQFRDASIYVSFKTLRRLRWVAKAVAASTPNPFPHMLTRPLPAPTVDEFVDKLINEVLIERYPTLLQHEKRIAEAEESFAATLLPGGTSVSNVTESDSASSSQN